jgi:hypothetical protein
MKIFKKLYAYLFGYFWLPCDLCGEYFGGFEWVHYGVSSIYEGEYKGLAKGICPKCTSILNYHCMELKTLKGGAVEINEAKKYIRQIRGD